MHLDCGTCERLKRAIRAEEKDSEGRLIQQNLLDDHLDEQRAHKRYYYDTRAKVSNYCCSALF
jgi:hypothetical protein